MMELQSNLIDGCTQKAENCPGLLREENKRENSLKTSAVKCRGCKQIFETDNYRERYCSIDCRINSQTSKQKNGCWVWKGAKIKSGYPVMNAGKIQYVHRLVYEKHHGPAGDKFVCHTCDNPSCVNPDHLWIGTHDDNMRDMSKKKRSPNLGKPRPKSVRRKISESKRRYFAEKRKSDMMSSTGRNI